MATRGPPGATVVSTVQLIVVDAGPALPAWSTLRTRKVWTPSASPWRVNGDVHAANGAPSTLHADVVPASPVNWNRASRIEVVAGGCAEITGADDGGTVSTVHTIVACGEALPAASTCHATT